MLVKTVIAYKEEVTKEEFEHVINNILPLFRVISNLVEILWAEDAELNLGCTIGDIGVWQGWEREQEFEVKNTSHDVTCCGNALGAYSSSGQLEPDLQ